MEEMDARFNFFIMGIATPLQKIKRIHCHFYSVLGNKCNNLSYVLQISIFIFFLLEDFLLYSAVQFALLAIFHSSNLCGNFGGLRTTCLLNFSYFFKILQKCSQVRTKAVLVDSHSNLNHWVLWREQTNLRSALQNSGIRFWCKITSSRTSRQKRFNHKSHQKSFKIQFNCLH